MLAAAALTSLAAWGATRLLARRSPGAWRLALLRTVECAGLSLVFLALNVLVELTLVLATRRALGRFVSLYYAEDVMIIALSCVQGVALCWYLARE